MENSEVMQWPSLAKDFVRYVGEPVAVAAAQDRYRAEDAAQLVVMDVDPLDPLLDPAHAAQPGAREIFEGYGNVVSTDENGGPVGDALASAGVVVEGSWVNQRVAPTSMEARAIAAVPDGDGLLVHCSHQAPHRLRDALSNALGVGVHVVVPKVGGAFGAKSQTYPEYVVVCYLARMLGRPVRWIEDRREALFAATHGRGQHHKVRIAADHSGHITALEVRIDADIGAYPHTGAFVSSMTAWVMSGQYRIENLHVVTRKILTNKPPTASYRGAGRPEAAYTIERAVDLLAARLHMDPVELRLKNMVPRDAFPYRSPTGALYDSGDYEGALRVALEAFGYEDMRREQQRRRSEGPETLLGIGVATWIERSGGQANSPEWGTVEIDPEGTVVALSGTTSQGQGNTTALTQIVAGALDIEPGRVRVVQGDTRAVPKGFGTFASRSIQVGGGALNAAARTVVEHARSMASAELEVASEDLVYEAGTFSVRGTDRAVSIFELAGRSALRADGEYRGPQAFPFGAYIVAVEIDPGTGRVDLARFVAVDDVGVVVNPMLTEGQVIGSIAQGIGQALYEEVMYDEDGQPLTTTFMDYSVPTLMEIPDVDMRHTVTPNPNHPLGVKGAGEAGCIGAPPAIINAIHDALGADHHLVDMPASPERVWRALALTGRGRSDTARPGGSSIPPGKIVGGSG